MTALLVTKKFNLSEELIEKMRNHQVKVRQVSSLKTAKTSLEQASQEMFDIIILDNNIRTKKDEMPIE